MKYEETAKRLKQAMCAKGLRQQDLADLSGVSKSNISHYVNGNHIPDNVMALKLAKVLNVQPDWLMGIDKAPEYMLVERSELYETINRMDDKKKQRVLAYVKALMEEVSS